MYCGRMFVLTAEVAQRMGYECPLPIGGQGTSPLNGRWKRGPIAWPSAWPALLSAVEGRPQDFPVLLALELGLCRIRHTGLEGVLGGTLHLIVDAELAGNPRRPVCKRQPLGSRHDPPAREGTRHLCAGWRHRRYPHKTRCTVRHSMAKAVMIHRQIHHPQQALGIGVRRPRHKRGSCRDG